MRTSKRLESVPPYLFAQIDQKKKAAVEKGIDIIDLGVGDPDQPTPPFIIDALKQAVDDPTTHNYPPYQGTRPYRVACAAWYLNRFGVTLDPDTEVMSLIGSKEGIAHLAWGILDPGDVAILPDPGYPVYEMGTRLAGATPYFLPLHKEHGFLPDFSAIDRNILGKAKLLYLNYPNNPTAAVATKACYEAAVAFCQEHDLLLCSDLAYSEMTYDGYVAPSVLEVPGAKEVAIEFHSLSKTCHMTGWRVGMAVGSRKALAALSVIKTNVDSGIFKAIQQAAIVALDHASAFAGETSQMYTKRRDILIDGLNGLGWSLTKPKATFYVWAEVPKGMTAMTFCEKMLDEAGILVVPGNGYGAHGEGFFRAAITVPEARLTEAIQRMNQKGITKKS